MAPETVQTQLDGPVLTVTMDRPDRRNAFNPEMVADLTRAFRDAARDPDVRVIVLAGAGPVFSAGADLDSMRAMGQADFEDNVADALRLADLLDAVRDAPKPVVARVQGAAMGGGSGLVAASDIAVAADNTTFAFSEARIGLAPAVIAPYVLPRIGVSAARELFLTGEGFDTQRAMAIGLVARVVPESELDQAVAERVDALLQAAPGAQAAIKRLIRQVSAQSGTARDYTARTIAALRASDEGREGTTAFLERREPAWRQADE